MSKVIRADKSKKELSVFIKFRDRLGTREVVAPAMGTNRITLFRWETGVHPIPRWAFIMVGLLVAKYPDGLPDPRAVALLRGGRRPPNPSAP